MPVPAPVVPRTLVAPERPAATVQRQAAAPLPPVPVSRARRWVERRRAKPAPAPSVLASGRLAVVVRWAVAQAGKPYRFGSVGPGAFDCSGLVMAAFARIGIALPHRSGAIGRMGRPVPRALWVPGTILAYPGHVAIYLGGGLMVHAANPRRGVLVAAVYGNPQGRAIG